MVRGEDRDRLSDNVELASLASWSYAPCHYQLRASISQCDGDVPELVVTHNTRTVMRNAESKIRIIAPINGRSCTSPYRRDQKRGSTPKHSRLRSQLPMISDGSSGLPQPP